MEGEHHLLKFTQLVMVKPGLKTSLQNSRAQASVTFSLRYVSLAFTDPPTVQSLHGSDVSPLRATGKRWETSSRRVAEALALDLLCRDACPFRSCSSGVPYLN